MANWSKMSVPELIEAATTLYTNARDNAEIVDALTEFGYERDPGPEDDAGDYDDGLALVADVTRERSEFAAEEADEDEANAALAAAVGQLYGRLVQDRKRARRAFPRGTDGYAALRLAGTLTRVHADLAAAADDFYGTIAGRPDLVGPIRGLSPERAAEGTALVTAYRTAATDQARESGEVDVAARELREAVAALRAHASQLAADAEDALADHPQLREVLGLRQRTGRGG